MSCHTVRSIVHTYRSYIDAFVSPPSPCPSTFRYAVYHTDIDRSRDVKDISILIRCFCHAHTSLNSTDWHCDGPATPSYCSYTPTPPRYPGLRRSLPMPQNPLVGNGARSLPSVVVADHPTCMENRPSLALAFPHKIVPGVFLGIPIHTHVHCFLCSIHISSFILVPFNIFIGNRAEASNGLRLYKMNQTLACHRTYQAQSLAYAVCLAIRLTDLNGDRAVRRYQHHVPTS